MGTFLATLFLAWWIFYNKEQTMGQTEDLRAAVGQLGVDLGEATARVLAKIAELGDPDPDLAADIAAIQDVSVALDDLVAGDVPVPPVEEIPA